jgi:3-hydroxyacyl-CoA dehydrogenase/3a,7a,12a-trihydroxy-5b-cholest-24-enoyl-CoA hydratase
VSIDVKKVLGVELPESTYSYTARDVILYALGIGAGAREDELKYVYENGLEVFPTFGVIPPFGALLSLLGVEGFKINPLMVLHGEQFMELRKRPVATSGTLVTRSSVGNIFDKGKGALVEIEAETTDEAGDVVFYNVFGAFIRGEGGFGGDRGPSAGDEPPERSPDAVVEERTLTQQALIYRLSADFNPLHADPAVAVLAGYDRPILHGMCTSGFACRAVLREFADGDAHRFSSFKVRLSGHVFPGETVVTRMWDEGGGKVVFTVTTKERGAVAVSNASVTLHD